MINSPILSLIFPRHCPACEMAHGPDVDLGADSLCGECSERLRPIEEPFCKCCGEPFDGFMSDEFRCAHCAGRVFSFEFAIAGYRSSGPAREIIHRFKYGKQTHLARVCASLLGPALDDSRISGSGLDWALVPVPLHWLRRYKRGFNQAEELCRYLSKSHGLPVRNCLKRIRNTRHQALLDRGARLKNLQGSIRLRRRFANAISGLNVLLVDDVFTTGSTAQECAHVLRLGGAETVVVVTMARG